MNAPSGTTYMQGLAVPQSSVNPMEFFARTRRRQLPEYQKQWAGFGNEDVITLKKADIIAGIFVRVVGTVTVTPGSGTVATKRRWPYDLFKKIKFAANGQSNLFNASGIKYKAREFMAKGDLSDRGVERSVAGATVRQGTLSQSCENWGVGSGATAIGAGSYDLDIFAFIPVAEDQEKLLGAIFAATSSTDLTINVEWAPIGEMFTFTGNGTATADNLVLQVEVIRYSIPTGGDGQIIVPDLSIFHSMIQNKASNLVLGSNEPNIVGQGTGKTLLRMFTQVWNNNAPLELKASNFDQLGWLFGSNEAPDAYPDGGVLRYINERMYNTDIGGVWGFHCHEFAVENAFRDTLDMGTASELRQLITLDSGLTLVNCSAEVVTETVFASGQGA